MATTSIEQLSINTIRTLSMDAVQAANSGHPGTPMALAPVTYTLWTKHFHYSPDAPHWPGRDRFILSCGHASMLLYSMIHLSQIKKTDDQDHPTGELAITLDDIKNFRQLHSPCAGHPEFGEANGIETTTGPLGQGAGNSVGMAMASRWFAARYNRPGFELFDFDVYALCSDGDLMEGVGCEAASLAGHLKLGNLCWIYDDNHITIEGDTNLAFSEDVGKRFEGLGWNVVQVSDANDTAAISAAIENFKQTDDQPTLIIVRSVIAWGAPNAAGTAAAHGAPLGDDEIKLAKQTYGWPDEKFVVPPEVPEHFANTLGARGSETCEAWHALFDRYSEQFPGEALQLKQIWGGELPEGWDRDIPSFDADAKGMASRGSSGKVLNKVAANIPWMIGGSADLAPSTKTLLGGEDAGHLSPENHGGRNLHFGVREHAMGAICNGLSLAGLRAYGATFFVFTDYMKASMRLAAIMGRPVLYVFTHDSIGVGEDGPTHQPVEHLAALRAIPKLVVLRPGDANEVAESYRIAVAQQNRPVALVLTRQNLPTLDRSQYGPAAGTVRGGYILADSEGVGPDVILMATGSELSIAVDAHSQLSKAGIRSRVVSMPSWELFDEQDAEYRENVLPAACPHRIAIEAGVEFGWHKYLGLHGKFVGMTGFGASAPFAELYPQFGITADAVVKAAKEMLG